MLTAIIDALEGRDMALVDIPGAYLSKNMNNELHTVFRVTIADIMAAANPAIYRKLVSYETGKAVLYVVCIIYYMAV